MPSSRSETPKKTLKQSQKNTPARERKEFLEKIDEVLGLELNFVKLTRGEASDLIERHSERFHKEKDAWQERMAREYQEQRAQRLIEERNAKKQKLQERLSAQVVKFKEKNVTAKGKPVSDPVEAVKIVGGDPCIHTNEFILLDDALNNIPPYDDCPNDCKLNCKFEGVKKTAL